MLPHKSSADYRRFDQALQLFQAAVYLGHGKPDPLPAFVSDTKQPVKIIDASVNAKVQPGADRSEVKTEGISVETSEADPTETPTETKTAAESDSKVDTVGSEATAAPGSTAATMDATVDTDAVTTTQTPRAKSKKSIPLWDRLTRTPLQSKRAAQVEREQKVDAGPAGGSLDLTMTLSNQPQSDLYLDVTAKVVSMLS